TCSDECKTMKAHTLNTRINVLNAKAATTFCPWVEYRRTLSRAAASRMRTREKGRALL
ncbi:hypothetical protein XENOCAPTIV_027934, partial [Xenoophorus captivus]